MKNIIKRWVKSIGFWRVKHISPVGQANYRDMSLIEAISKPLRAGFFLIFIQLLLIFVWGGGAQLDSAVISQGNFTPSNRVKRVQHYEGGIIQNIFVRDGDVVKLDQKLIELNSAAASAHASVALTALRSRVAAEARIYAELYNAETIHFDSPYLHDEAESRIIKDSQEKIFAAKKDELKSALSIFSRDIMRYEQRIKGLEEQYESLLRSRDIKREILDDIDELYKKDAISKHMLLRQRSEYQESLKMLEQIKSDIKIAYHEIEKVKLAEASFKHQRYLDLAKDYEKNHTAYLEALERYNNLRSILDRVIIKAPAAGIVTASAYHSVGEIAPPGKTLMQIVPQDDLLIIEAKVALRDIHNIKVGMSAKVQLDSYKKRLVPRVEGKVIYVSADKVESVVQSAGKEHYIVRVEVNKESLNSLSEKVDLYPGMPATVFLVRGKRSVLSYIISPLIESFRKGFKEQ